MIQRGRGLKLIVGKTHHGRERELALGQAHQAGQLGREHPVAVLEDAAGHGDFAGRALIRRRHRGSGHIPAFAGGHGRVQAAKGLAWKHRARRVAGKLRTGVLGLHRPQAASDDDAAGVFSFLQ